MNKYKFFISILACVFVLGCAAKKQIMPLEEATIRESTNPAEVLVEAKGVGYTTEEAIQDARRSAVWAVVEGGSDPLLQTQEERARFKAIREEFYSVPMLNKFISDETRAIVERLELEGGIIKITKHFTVNERMMREDLENWNPPIIIRRPEILPTIMVIPEVPKGQNPVEMMSEDPTLKHAAQVIESYLTNRRYDVQAPEQKITIDSLTEAQQAFKGMEDDYSYQTALSTGSDVYVTFTLDIQTRDVGGSTVRKAIVGVRAYETATALLLGTETGYSEERPEADLVVIEEAVHGAIDKVLSRINAYWKEALKRGVPYKLVISIQGDFDSDEREDIAFAMSRVMKQNCKSSKENIATEQTLDYLVWVDSTQITNSRDLYATLRRDFSTEFRQGQLRSINITGKLILLRVTETGN